MAAGEWSDLGAAVTGLTIIPDPPMQPPMEKAILLLSGGIDSVTLLYDMHTAFEVHPLLVDYGQPHRQELQWAITHARRLGLLWTTYNLPELGGLLAPDWIVPNRNAVLISLAVNLAAKAGATTVAIGCNKDDQERFPDCRPDFIEAMQNATWSASYCISIKAPYSDLTKKQVLEKATGFDINLRETWSCYRGGVDPCGICLACLKIKEALR